jgi:hypothetical protein
VCVSLLVDRAFCILDSLLSITLRCQGHSSDPSGQVSALEGEMDNKEIMGEYMMAAWDKQGEDKHKVSFPGSRTVLHRVRSSPGSQEWDWPPSGVQVRSLEVGCRGDCIPGSLSSFTKLPGLI